MSPSKTQRYAQRYASRGLAVVPIPVGQKNPVLPSWPHLRIEPENVAEYFNGYPQNIGILLGEPSGGVVDVDCDVQEAVSAAPYFLPKTTRSGRESSPESHWWYRSEGVRTQKFMDMDGRTLLELRSTGHQTLVAPSLHPEGDRYLWAEGAHEIVEISPEVLSRRCRLLATATLVARHLPPVGGRHYFALALAGFLLRDDRLDQDEALRVMEAAWSVARAATVEAEHDLRGVVRDTARNIASGAEVVGGRRLEELAPGLPRVLGRWWKWGFALERPEVEGPPRSAHEADSWEHEERSAQKTESSPDTSRSLPEAAAFPVEALPEPCRRFVVEGAQAIGCPPDFLGMGVLATLSVAIGASRVLRIKRSWCEGASLFLAVVAPPGAKKTPAAKAATEPVRDHQARLQREYRKGKERYEQEMREWEVEKKLAYKNNESAPREPEKPDMGRVIADDTTVEALVTILEPNPRGLLVDRDELTGWVRSMDQYKGGKGGDRQHWLSIWSNKAVVVDRKSRAGEPVILPRPWVSLFGGLQPTMLKELGGLQEDGLLDRFLFAYPTPTRSLFSDIEISAEAERAFAHLYQALATMEMVEDEYGALRPGVVPMSEGARAVWKERVDALADEVYGFGFPSRLEGLWSKLEGYLARLSLIFALARSKETGQIERVQAGDVEAAGRLIDYFKVHARRVYAELKSATPQDLLAGELKELLEEHGGEWIGSATELYEILAERDAPGLPESPDWLARIVLAIARRTERLEAKRGTKGSGKETRRVIKLKSIPSVSRDSSVSAPALADNTTNTTDTTSTEAAPENRPKPQRAPQAADEPGRGITAPGTGAVQGVPTKEKPAERCIHELPGGKGCYLCDSNHPQRKMERRKR